jgi:aryl-alcohol dehydrogenase-like predicted oxidoreductase
MFTRRLGRSNLEVSAMGLGCWMMGDQGLLITNRMVGAR